MIRWLENFPTLGSITSLSAQKTATNHLSIYPIMKEALDVVRMHNLCTYYLLPLIGINKFSFGVTINFRNCYCNPDGTELYVTVYYTLSSLTNHPNLIRIEGKAGAPVYVFSLPQKWQLDFQLYKQGRYSKFSNEAKELIRNQSGLRYKAINPNGQPTTDIRLLAIEADPDRRKILRAKLSEYLEVSIAEDAELLDVPPPSSFVAQFDGL